MRVKSDFKLLTEEAFRSWISDRPELQQRHRFQGYCALTQNRVEFGPELISRHNCDNCYPESHFIMVPTDLLESNS
ncbi:MAG: hypothetical protein ACM3NT_01355 [Methylocystaceae bacterium]